MQQTTLADDISDAVFLLLLFFVFAGALRDRLWLRQGTSFDWANLKEYNWQGI